jgi:hypothetical protein
LRHPGGSAEVAASGAMRVAAAHFCPEFGRRIATTCLELQVAAGHAARFELRW